MKKIKLTFHEEYLEQSGIFFHKHTKKQVSQWGYWAFSNMRELNEELDQGKSNILIYVCQYITSKTIRNKAILKKYNNENNYIQLVLE